MVGLRLVVGELVGFFVLLPIPFFEAFAMVGVAVVAALDGLVVGGAIGLAEGAAVGHVIGAAQVAGIFLQKSKAPPMDLVSHFLQMYSRKSGGVIWCDQGRELSRSHDFRTTMMEKHLYVLEPTGADSPSQDSGTKKWNDTLAVTTRALLYGAALPAQYWSAALTP